MVPITATEARALAETPWFLRAIIEAAFKGKYETTLEFTRLSDAHDAIAVMQGLGHAVGRVKQKDERDGILYEVTVRW